MAKVTLFPSQGRPEKRVLFWTDNPLGFTGFGKVSREIIKQLLKDPDITYKIDVVGISFWGDRPDEPLGYTLYSALQPGQNIDLFGHAKVFSLLSTNDYDALFILNDLPVVARCLKDILNIREKHGKTFKIIHYFPVDGPVWPEEVKGSLWQIDYPVAYTFYGRGIVSAIRATDKEKEMGLDRDLSQIPVIYHGTDKDMFRPFATEAERVSARKFWDNGVSVNSSKFIVLNVNRNQPRKDYAKTFEVFAEFHKRVPDSYMFCMADPADIGGDLIRIAAQYGLTWGKDWWSAPVGSQTKSNGFPEQQIAQLYRISDVCISTAVGEGWGLSLTEAMASGTPVVFPRHSSCQEIIGENEERGFLADVGDMDGTITFGQNDRNVLRPRVWVKDMVKKMLMVYEMWLMREPFSNDARSWTPTWDSVGPAWRKVFAQATQESHESQGDPHK